MSEPAPAASGNPRAGAVARQIRLAASFLTILPFVSTAPYDAEDVAASYGWFPMIGFALGVALALEDALLAPVFGHATRAVLIVLTLTIVTGAVHLDGLSDTADSFGAGRNRDRALEIMRDSRIGSYGAAALFFALTLKVLAIASIIGARRYEAIFAAEGLSRWAMVAVASGLDYARPGGAGAALLGPGNARGNLRIASLTVAAAMIPILSWTSGWAIAIAIAVTIAMRAFYRRWLGGITGDLIGACGEIVEIAVLLAMSR